MNGGDTFSLQRILGHTTLDMVRRYVGLSDADLAVRHRAASPGDRLLGKPIAGGHFVTSDSDAPQVSVYTCCRKAL
ncbi:MAG: hypothetical protein WD736_04825 [Chloroflexota bacterium]